MGKGLVEQSFFETGFPKIAPDFGTIGSSFHSTNGMLIVQGDFN